MNSKPNDQLSDCEEMNFFNSQPKLKQSVLDAGKQPLEECVPAEDLGW